VVLLAPYRPLKNALYVVQQNEWQQKTNNADSAAFRPSENATLTGLSMLTLMCGSKQNNT
jgi:hypothetical protein